MPADGAFHRMSIARIVMKKTKKKTAVYSANASAASKVMRTRRMLDIENVSSASQRPKILMKHTACPVRQTGRTMKTSHVASERSCLDTRCAIVGGMDGARWVDGPPNGGAEAAGAEGRGSGGESVHTSALFESPPTKEAGAAGAAIGSVLETRAMASSVARSSADAGRSGTFCSLRKYQIRKNLPTMQQTTRAYNPSLANTLSTCAAGNGNWIPVLMPAYLIIDTEAVRKMKKKMRRVFGHRKWRRLRLVGFAEVGLLAATGVRGTLMGFGASPKVTRAEGVAGSTSWSSEFDK